MKAKQIINTGLIICLLSAAIFAGCSGGKNNTADEKDPYLWLEDVEGDKALDWVRSQNGHTEEAFTARPLFNILNERFTEVLNDKEQIVYPEIVGKYVYNLWQDEKNERGLWRRMPLADYLDDSKEWEVVLDLDILSENEDKKWVFHGVEWLLPENRYCLVYLSDGGKDESYVREFDVVEKAFVSDGFSVDESKGSVSWIDRDNILVASDFGRGTMSSSGYPLVVKHLRRGTKIEDAIKVIEADTTYMGIFVSAINSGSKHYVFLTASRTFFERDLYLFGEKGPRKIGCPSDADFFGMNKGEMLFYLQSDWIVNDQTHASGSLVSINLELLMGGTLSVKTIYRPDERSSFVSLLSAKDFIIVQTMENVQSKLSRYSLKDDVWTCEPVPAPSLGTISLIASDDQTEDYFFDFSNLITPSTLFYGNEKEIKPVQKQKDYFVTGDLVLEQYEAWSSDSTRVPYFIVHRKDMEFNSANPVLIWAYGGFNSPEQPYYSAMTGIGWLEQGGIYVIANIRGGGEFGPAWHKAAMKEKRQNAYNDFYAVSEDLIDRKITSPEHLGAFGWSNGGLLAGVVFTQRPDLYRAVVVAAPLLDMKRYSKLLAGASWMGEYGDPDIPQEWAYIKKYSPYHNVSKDKKYPEVLFITSTKDDRVHPAHARKMAAKMADMGHPFYYHETIEGGHGAASTNAQQAYVWATIYTYLNMKLIPGK